MGPEGSLRPLRRRSSDGGAPGDRREGVRKLNRSYLLCGTSRSGSNLLCGLLKGTGVAGRPEEYFWRGHESYWARRWGTSGPAEYLQAAVAEGTTANGVFGAKVMWHQMPDLLAKLTAVHGARRRSDRALLQRTFPRLRFVWIWREEVVAQAVSFARALQTDEWTATAQRRLAGTPRFDFDQIHRLLREVIEHNEAWERWFAHNGIRPFRIRYEDLSQDMNGVTHGLLAFLGLELPDGKVIEPKHDRQADHTNAEWVDRYRAIALT